MNMLIGTIYIFYAFCSLIHASEEQTQKVLQVLVFFVTVKGLNVFGCHNAIVLGLDVSCFVGKFCGCCLYG